MESKESKYNTLIAQIKSLILGETDRTAILSNVVAAMHDTFPEEFFWCGFYLVKDDELLLAPFQGSVACYHIKYGKGVCGTAWAERQTIIVPDVEQFAGHIACSSLSRSEIVVPIFGQNNTVLGVIDIDSRELNTFDKTDQHGLEEIAMSVANIL